MMTRLIYILVAILLTAGPARTELVGWWGFDESGMLGADYSGMGNDGMVTGNCMLTQDAVAGSGALQAAGGYVNLYSCDSGVFSGDFSSGQAAIVFWIKLDATNPVWPGNGLLNIGSWCYPTTYPSTANTMSFKAFLSSGDVVTVSLPTNTVLSAWHQLAICADAQDIATGYKVYFDGLLLGAFPMDGRYGNFIGPQRPRIGATFDVASNTWSYLYGKVDELRIYNQVLTQAQVQNLMYSSDFDNDAQVNYVDLSYFGYVWLWNCAAPDWCAGIDINRDTVVNFKDFSYLAQQWMQRFP